MIKVTIDKRYAFKLLSYTQVSCNPPANQIANRLLINRDIYRFGIAFGVIRNSIIAFSPTAHI